MDCEKIYITDEFYWRKEDFDKNIASRSKKRPVVWCAHDKMVQQHGCSRCEDMFKETADALATELWRLEKQKSFIEMAKSVHIDGKYGYSNVYYTTAHTNVNITCLACDEDFPQRPANHLTGAGCRICGYRASAVKRRKLIDTFVREANEVHNGKYTYLNFEYRGAHEAGLITCPIHGDFPQCPGSHLQGCGCSKCGDQAMADKHRKTLETFIREANKTHENRYTYGNFVYIDSHTPGFITCSEHGDFPQKPCNHLGKGSGCPMCRDKTEGIVFLLLKDTFEPMGFKVEHMGTRVSQGVGKMDIRITKGDVVIYVEVDGRHHFEYVPEYKSEANEVQARDLKKHIRATAKGHVIVRIDQVWVWESHVANKTEWSSRLRQTIVKLVSGVEPSIDDLFLSNRPDKYFNHSCYQQMKRSS